MSDIFEKLKFQTLQWARIGSYYVVKPPEDEPFQPIVTEYRGVEITQTSLNNFTFHYGEYTYAYNDYYSCVTKIDALLAVIPKDVYFNDCNDFTGVSSYNNHLPEQGESAWIFKVPAYTKSWIDIITDKRDFSFGEYEVKFKANGHLVNIYCPLFTISPNMGADRPYSELDFVEMFGFRASRQIAMTSWYPDPSSSDTTGDFQATREFEDGFWHWFRFTWRETGEISMWLNGVFQRSWTPRVENQTKPPVRLVCNVTNNTGENPSDFEMQIDYIKYTAF